MLKNYRYDGSLKQKAAENRSNEAANVSTDVDDVLKNNGNILKTDPDARHSQGIRLGDPDSADLRIVALGHAGSGNSSLMLRLFYNEYDDDPENNKLLQWEQHQMNYKYSDTDTLRISYFDLKGFDDVLSHSEMSNRIGNVINHGCNVILLYYSITNPRSFQDDSYSVQNIKKYVANYLNLIDHKKFITILIGLQSDLKNERKISFSAGAKLAKQWGNIPFIEVSAKTNKNVEKLLRLICKIYTNGYEMIDGDLNEAAAFDEDKVIEKSAIKENDEYDEYQQKTPHEQRFNNFFDIIVTNDDGIDEDQDYNMTNTTRIIDDFESSEGSFPYNAENSDGDHDSEEKEIEDKPLDDKKFLAHIKQKKSLKNKKDKPITPPPESDESGQQSNEESSNEQPIPSDDNSDEKEIEEKAAETTKSGRSVFIKKKKKMKPITPPQSESESDDSDEASHEEVEHIPDNPLEQTKKRRLPKKQIDKTPIVSTYVEPLKDKPLDDNNNNESDTELPPIETEKKMNNKPLEDDYNEPPAPKPQPQPQPQQAMKEKRKEKPLYYDDEKKEAQTNKFKERAARPPNLGLSKKTMSVDEFMAVPLQDIFINDDSLRDNFDIAKKICKFFDGQFGDSDTVCMVSESGKQPAISYWVKGDYVRKHKEISGKHIMVYRACKHRECKQPKVSRVQFEKYVKKISIEYEDRSVNKICDLMDDRYGEGCHYARSTATRPSYDIYSRFSDKYDCGFKLPSGAYVIAWRR